MIFGIPKKHIAVILMTAVVITILTLMTTGPVMLIINAAIFVIYIIWLDKLDDKIGWKTREEKKEM